MFIMTCHPCECLSTVKRKSDPIIQVISTLIQTLSLNCVVSASNGKTRSHVEMYVVLSLHGSRSIVKNNNNDIIQNLPAYI